jgi:hypothetical protein
MTQFLVSLLPFAVLALFWIVLMGHLQKRLANDSRVEQPESHAETLEPRDVWSLSGAIHTYRDPDVLKDSSPAPRSGIFHGVLLIPLLLLMLVVVFASASTVVDRAAGVVAIGLFFGITYFGDKRYRDSLCGEIRLGDDGTCELETKRRVIRLHVNQIKAVKYENDSDRRAAYYIVYHGGSVPLDSTMTGLADFLSRLKTLNPAVDLSSFPGDWPGLGRPKGETGITTFVRRALFPLIVIALLVYLASQTLLSK